MADADILIRARGLTKAFGGAIAVDGIDFELSRGEVFGFLGRTAPASHRRCE
ncbi:MAG TPA: hypothetical protein VN840_17090 [Streptosporangiaceae bacterium]|nr:hypothetical protein [Streptosporangiaceae bacterium]